MRRSSKTILLCVLCVFINHIHAWAQHNAFGINDGLYKSYVSINATIRSPHTLARCDSAIREAEKINDKKAKCIFLGSKVDHYYYTDNYTKIFSALKTAQDYARTTPFKQYVFSSWNRIINMYLKQNQFQKALDETKRFQTEAYRLNNPYGISISYRHFGKIYHSMELLDEAISQFLKGADYLVKSNYTKELDQLYTPIANCYLNLHDYDNALKYLRLSRKYTHSKERIAGYYGAMLNTNLRKKNLDEAKKYIDSINSLAKERGGMSSQSRQSFLADMAFYHRLCGNYQKAIEYADQCKDDEFAQTQKYYALYQLGRYKECCDLMSLISSTSDSIRTAHNAEIISHNIERFNNERLTHEKDQLALANAQMLLTQSNDQAHLLLLDKEKNALSLNNALLQISNNNLKLEQKENLMKQKEAQIAKERAETAAQNATTRTQLFFAYTILFFALCIIVFIAIHHHFRSKDIKQLRFERDRAERADKLKSLFLQNMSHEIRTPLNAIVGFTELLNDPETDLETDERANFVSLIQTNSDLLITIINDILDLSRLESGTYTLSINDVDITQLCTETIASVAHRAEAGVAIKFTPPSGNAASHLAIKTDAKRVQQVLTNFLTNACKNTMQGSITLSYNILQNEDSSRQLHFTVTDTGCGVPADKVKDIFKRFEKLDDFKQGTGLGLNICTRIASLLNGTIGLDPDYTTGARFFLSIPID